MWILIANEDEQVAQYTARVLGAGGHRSRRARSWPDVVECLLASLCEVVLLDPELPGLEPEALERVILRSGPRRPRVILYGGVSPVELAVLAVALKVDACLSHLAGPTRLLHVVGSNPDRPPTLPPAHPTSYVPPPPVYSSPGSGCAPQQPVESSPESAPPRPDTAPPPGNGS